MRIGSNVSRRLEAAYNSPSKIPRHEVSGHALGIALVAGPLQQPAGP
jgi:hypothetical protein